MRNIIYSLFILFHFISFGQEEMSKLVRTNENNRTYRYARASVYGRGLLFDENRLFIGNSDGSVYYYNDNNATDLIVFKMKSLKEIRDIEKSGRSLIAMHSGDDGKLVRIGFDGSIKMISHPDWEGVFLDGMDFIDNHGFLMGDPTRGKFNLFRTEDGGITWDRCKGKVKADKGEAGFAASGTNVQMLDSTTYAFVSGGSISRFFKTTDSGEHWTEVVLPYYPGESSGAYSMCFADDKIGVIVGGDYLTPNLKLNTCFFTEDGGETWYNSETTVSGYRSCVFYVKGVFYACGLNGIDYSINNGIDWIRFANGTFYSLESNGTHLIATSNYGKIEFFNLIRKR